MAVRKKHLAIFGNTSMHRIYCRDCKGMTLVREGIKLCCDGVVDDKGIKKFKIECIPPYGRRKPPFKTQQRILKEQENKCLYCGREFGSLYYRNGKIMQLRLNWDHLIPYSYSRKNKDNFVASCHICNGIKSNKLFDTIEEVYDYVYYRRQKKGITYLDEVPDVPKTVPISQE